MSYDWTRGLQSADVAKRLRHVHGANSRCTLKLRADIHEAVHHAQAETRDVMGAIGSTRFRIKAGQTVNYAINGKSNQFAFGEVLKVGCPKWLNDGTPDELPSFARGDVVGLDLGQVGHELPMQDGMRRCLALWEIILCKFAPGDEYPTPLQDYVMTLQSDDVTNRFAFNGAKLIAPARKAGATKTNDKRRSSVGLHCEIVLAAGPGRNVRHKLLPGGVQRGDWAMFTNHCSVDLMWRRGELLRFTPWSKIEGVISDRDPYGEGT